METNFAGLAFANIAKNNPEVFEHVTNPEKVNKQLAEEAKQRRAIDAKNTLARNTLPDLRKEYNQLRQTLFDLKQNAKCFEIRCNEAAGNIKVFEQRINDLLKQKKDANEAGNLRGVRNYEQNVQLLEAELVDAQSEFDKNKRWSGQAARALRDFSGHARIEELKLLLDEPLPEVKK